MKNKIHPVSLKNMARKIAMDYRDKGAIIISVGDDGTQIGTIGLTHDELNIALCTAIHYNFCFEEDDL